MERRQTRSSASLVADTFDIPVRQVKRRRENGGSEAGPSSSAVEDVVTPDAMTSARCNYEAWMEKVRNEIGHSHPCLPKLPEGHEILEQSYQCEMDFMLAAVSDLLVERAGNLERPSPEKYVATLMGRFGKLGSKSVHWGELARGVAAAGIYDGLACAPMPLVTRCTEAQLEAALASATAEQTRLTVALGITTAENARLRAERDEAQSQRDEAQAERDEAQACTRCVICLSEPKRILFLPCKHINCCADCAPEQERRGVCPVCREAIVATTEVFF